MNREQIEVKIKWQAERIAELEAEVDGLTMHLEDRNQKIEELHKRWDDENNAHIRLKGRYDALKAIQSNRDVQSSVQSPEDLVEELWEQTDKVSYKELAKYTEQLQQEIERLKSPSLVNDELLEACKSALWSGAIRFANNALDRSIKEKLEAAIAKASKEEL
jgi:chromosome condensin MukBEF ATPase and DNA-binding subunit MukB